MLAIFVALGAEQRCIQPHLEVLDRFEVDQFPVVMGTFANKAVLLCRSGPGQRALAAADAVFARYPPQSVLSLGFAGGLQEGQAAGELVLCHKVCGINVGQSSSSPDRKSGGLRPSPASEPVVSTEGLLRLARRSLEETRLPFHQGMSLTVDAIIRDPQDKQALARCTGAQVVEMESYWVGQAARRQGVPFLAVRTVVDGPHDVVPASLNLVTEGGSIHGGRALIYALGHPRDIPNFLRLTRNLARASHRLSAFAKEFLTLWSRET